MYKIVDVKQHTVQNHMVMNACKLSNGRKKKYSHINNANSVH